MESNHSLQDVSLSSLPMNEPPNFKNANYHVWAATKDLNLHPYPFRSSLIRSFTFHDPTVYWTDMERLFGVYFFEPSVGLEPTIYDVTNIAL